MNMKNEIGSWKRLGYDITPYINYKQEQLEQIRYGLISGLDVSVYDDINNTASEMTMYRLALHVGISPEQIKTVQRPEKALFLAKVKHRELDVEEAINWVKQRKIQPTVMDEIVDLYEWSIDPKDYVNNPSVENIYKIRNLIILNEILGTDKDYLVKELVNEDVSDVKYIYSLLYLLDRDEIKNDNNIYNLVELETETRRYIDILAKADISGGLTLDETLQITEYGFQQIIKEVLGERGYVEMEGYNKDNLDEYLALQMLIKSGRTEDVQEFIKQINSRKIIWKDGGHRGVYRGCFHKLNLISDERGFSEATHILRQKLRGIYAIETHTSYEAETIAERSMSIEYYKNLLSSGLPEIPEFLEFIKTNLDKFENKTENTLGNLSYDMNIRNFYKIMTHAFLYGYTVNEIKEKENDLFRQRHKELSDINMHEIMKKTKELDLV